MGGALLSLEIGGAQVLRRCSATPAGVLETACFPLIPFANRIAEGRFRYAGCDISLPADAATPPHAHHGHGWRRPWTLAELTPSTAMLTYLHHANQWPWTYRASQRLVLLPDGLVIELEVANLASTAMPCGFGLHPYFALETGSYIAIVAPDRLLPDQRGIACLPAPGLTGQHELSTLPASDDLLLALSGQATVGTADWEISLCAEHAIGWHFYLPPSRAYFCLEPVSHRPDSFNQIEVHDSIAAGASRHWRFELNRTR
jgi:aldose 1-epimerase